MYSHRTYCLTFLGILFLPLIKYLFFIDLRHFGVWIISTIGIASTQWFQHFKVLHINPLILLLQQPHWEGKILKKIRPQLVSHVTTSSWWNKDWSIGPLDLSPVLLPLRLINLHKEFSGKYTYSSEIFVNVPTVDFLKWKLFLNGSQYFSMSY